MKNPVLKVLWLIYIICVWYPLGIIATILCAVTTWVGCTLGSDRVWGFYPGMIWSKFMCILAWCKVSVKGKENIHKGQSYVFASNHTSIYDVFLIYGYIGVPFKWIMKKEIATWPFIGWACKAAGFLFINRQKGREAFQTLQAAKGVFTGGVSLVVFPEGTRTRNGEIGKFKRGAFEIAKAVELPIIPMRIDGGFKVMPYNKFYPIPGPLKLTILPEVDFHPADHDDEFVQIEKIGELIVNS